MKNFFKRILHFIVVDWAACLLLAAVLVAGVVIAMYLQPVVVRSEERRVGKEC